MYEILVTARLGYGKTLVDVVQEPQRTALQKLTGNKTLTQGNINSLKALGFSFKLQPTLPNIKL